MFLACGVGAYPAAIFHVMTHAFFKAQLFLGSGSVIHGMHHEQDMRRLGGLRKYMKITFFTMMAGYLAICGFPGFAGFFSKDEILWKTFSTTAVPGGKIFWFIGALTALLTAVYMTRMMVMTFWGEERFGEDSHHAHGHDDAHADTLGHDGHGRHSGKPRESPWSMTIPLILLAILSVGGGIVGIPHIIGGSNKIEQILEPVMYKTAEHSGGGHANLQMLSPAPQPQDGAAPVQLINAALTEPAKANGGAAEHSGDAGGELTLLIVSSLIALVGMAIGCGAANACAAPSPRTCQAGTGSASSWPGRSRGRARLPKTAPK